jgi:hypothetical protein
MYPHMLDASHVLEAQSQSLRWVPRAVADKWVDISQSDQHSSLGSAINFRSKTRLLLQNMLKHTTTPIADTLRPYLSIYSTLCMVELDAVLDLKQSSHREELTSFQTRITVLKQEIEGIVPLCTSTFHNLRLWVEIFTHHQIDFVAPGFTAIELVSSMIAFSYYDWRVKDWVSHFTIDSESATLPGFPVFNWHRSDVEDSVLEAWQISITPTESNFESWCTFRDQERLIEWVQDNLQWILKLCFRLDIENGRGIRPDTRSLIEMLLGHTLVNMRTDFEQELDVLYGNYRTKLLLENVQLLMELPGWECDI